LVSYKEVKPKNPILKNYVSSYTYSIGSIEHSSSEYITRTFPTFYTQLYFEFFGDLSKLKNKHKTQTITKRTYINSGIGNWYDIYSIESNNQNILIKNLKVDLLPHTLFYLFDLSSKELLNQDLRVDDIWKDKTAYQVMLEQMESSKSGEQMIEVFEKNILEIIHKKDILHNQYLPFFLKYNSSLQEFSQNLGYSKRWIQNKYQDLFGINFKELNNNMRFLNLLQSIDKTIYHQKTIDLSSLAYKFDYYDQAHFTKDFKKYTGMTPKEYVDLRYKGYILFCW